MLNTSDGITKLRCKKHLYDNENNKTKILTKAVFHPAYLLRNPIEKKRMWEDLQDIDKIIEENKIHR